MLLYCKYGVTLVLSPRVEKFFTVPKSVNVVRGQRQRDMVFVFVVERDYQDDSGSTGDVFPRQKRLTTTPVGQKSGSRIFGMSNFLRQRR